MFSAHPVEDSTSVKKEILIWEPTGLKRKTAGNPLFPFRKQTAWSTARFIPILSGMRITSGKLKGRKLDVPDMGIRPTKEMVREAVFSSLAARLPGARVLDLFAGSGAYGIEAWSRGAASLTAVEASPSIFQTTQANIKTLCRDDAGGSCQAVLADVFTFLNRQSGPFDLIFADPPYADADLERLLKAVAQSLNAEGLLVFEMRSSQPASLPDGWVLLKEKAYGKTRILYLARNG